MTHGGDGQLRNQGVHKALHRLVWCRRNGPRCGLIFGTCPPTASAESLQMGSSPHEHPHSFLLVLLQPPPPNSLLRHLLRRCDSGCTVSVLTKMSPQG